MSNNKLERELQQARQSGAVPPAIDQSSGQMINPHNPEFLTKKPWYLSGDAAAAGGVSEPTLEHQADHRLDKDRLELSLSAAEQLLQKQREKHKQRAASGKFVKGQWVEGLKSNNRGPYRMCQILKVNKKGTEFDLQFEDGTIERRVKLNPKAAKPRVRMTKTGNRSHDVDAAVYGKETYDSKRDSYHGYDHESHNQKLEQKFKAKEAMRRQLRDEKQKAAVDNNNNNQNDNNNNSNNKDDTKAAAAASDSDFDDSDVESGDESDNEFVQRDEEAVNFTTRLARQGGVGGAQMKVTARNLRIREDTAKYLRNLDPNSAYYDPKSRSMRDNPNPEIAPEDSTFAGDNFARISGDAVGLADTQLFAWDATDKGVDEIHPQANPSQAELLKKQFKSKTADLKFQQKKAVLDKYGGGEYLDGTTGLASAAAAAATNDNGDNNKKPAAATTTITTESSSHRKLRFGVSSKTQEYGQDGRLKTKPGEQQQQQQRRKAIPCKYQEDVFTNGHTTVWGSYFHRGAFLWGYADDHSLMPNSYCTGANGRLANDEANELRYGTGKGGSRQLAEVRGLLKAIPGQSRKRKLQDDEGGDF